MIKEKLAFRIGTGAVLGVIAVLTYATGQAQRGPTWEVPVQAGKDLLLALILAVVLDLAALVAYLRGNRFRSQIPLARYGFHLLLTLSVVLFVGICIFDPGQWPAKSPHLSIVVFAAWAPTSVACVAVWLLSILLSKNGTVQGTR